MIDIMLRGIICNASQIKKITKRLAQDELVTNICICLGIGYMCMLHIENKQIKNELTMLKKEINEPKTKGE